MAAPFQNYTGGVLLADIVKRNNFSAYVSQAIKERSLFIQSGAVVRNALLDATAGGTRIQVPEFNPIAPTEEILDGTGTWGTSGAGYLTPQKIGTDTQIATICHRGFAYAVDDVAVLAAGEDPMGHIRNQLADAINKLNSVRLFETLTGLFHTALNGHRLEKQLGGSGSTTEANYLTGGVGVTDRSIGQFAGCTVVIDSQVNINDPTTTGNRQEFRCYLMKSGVILEGQQSELGIEAERNILSKQDVMSVDYHSAYHVMGTKWTNAADNPANSALRTGSNWGVTYDIDQIPMVEIFVNTPLSNGLKS
jgi:hypothetical protein